MVNTRSLGHVLGKVIGRVLGREDNRDSDDVLQRRRPTASARRQREVVVVAEDAPHVDDAVEEVFQHADEVVDDFEGFPRPRDPSVLIVYADHVAVIVWNEEERPELKLSSHGRKVQKFGRFAVEIERLVVGIRLSPLIAYSLDTGHQRLI
ncbi:uncharacterized protein [Glycine max]|uniref:uncharacterized protein isoform X1 n=2 Tax=Glycine max TaxID=3847 RepID=UPI001B3556FA|nr:uncharacterized protein LOC106796206 isoform X1 [Glycine max]